MIQNAQFVQASPSWTRWCLRVRNAGRSATVVSPFVVALNPRPYTPCRCDHFGWPTARENDPERAVRAGLAIVEAVRALKNPPVSPFFKGGEEPVPPFEKGGSGGISSDAATLHVRVGMHTGPAVIADGGEVFGETPNIAARVQAAAEPDTVLVSVA